MKLTFQIWHVLRIDTNFNDSVIVRADAENVRIIVKSFLICFEFLYKII